MFRSIGLSRPTLGQMRWYVRACTPPGSALALPGAVVCWPWLLSACQTLDKSSALDRRLHLASLLLDISPEGCRLAYARSASSRLAVFCRLFLLACTEGLVMLGRLVKFGPWT